MNPNVSFQLYRVNYGTNNKEYKLGNKVNQIVERPEQADKETSFSHIGNELHKTQQSHDKSSYGKETNHTSVKEDVQGQQAVCTKVGNLTNATDIGMNATHICGILMEPVNVNYTRNIYFTVKTTHKYYTNRLFLLMLTWLQTVDKNKVCM